MGALEAASQGTPIVLPENSGAWELFESGRDGIAYQDGDEESLAQALLALDDPDSVRKMGMSAWEKSKEYTWEAHCTSLVRLLGAGT